MHWEDPEGSGGERGERGDRNGDTCKPMADSFQCMTKPTTIKIRRRRRGKKLQLKKKGGGGDITLPTKVHLVNAMIFPVVMYGCESWTIKKTECQRIDAFEL